MTADADLIEVTDAAGRVMFRGPAAYLRMQGDAAERVASARFYAGELFMARPWSRPAWRAWLAARHAMRAEIRFRPFFV